MYAVSGRSPSAPPVALRRPLRASRTQLIRGPAVDSASADRGGRCFGSSTPPLMPLGPVNDADDAGNRVRSSGRPQTLGGASSSGLASTRLAGLRTPTSVSARLGERYMSAFGLSTLTSASTGLPSNAAAATFPAFTNGAGVSSSRGVHRLSRSLPGITKVSASHGGGTQPADAWLDARPGPTPHEGASGDACGQGRSPRQDSVRARGLAAGSTGSAGKGPASVRKPQRGAADLQGPPAAPKNSAGSDPGLRSTRRSLALTSSSASAAAPPTPLGEHQPPSQHPSPQSQTPARSLPPPRAQPPPPQVASPRPARQSPRVGSLAFAKDPAASAVTTGGRGCPSSRVEKGAAAAPATQALSTPLKDGGGAVQRRRRSSPSAAGDGIERDPSTLAGPPPPPRRRRAPSDDSAGCLTEEKLTPGVGGGTEQRQRGGGRPTSPPPSAAESGLGNSTLTQTSMSDARRNGADESEAERDAAGSSSGSAKLLLWCGATPTSAPRQPLEDRHPATRSDTPPRLADKGVAPSSHHSDRRSGGGADLAATPLRPLPQYHHARGDVTRTPNGTPNGNSNGATTHADHRRHSGPPAKGGGDGGDGSVRCGDKGDLHAEAPQREAPPWGRFLSPALEEGLPAGDETSEGRRPPTPGTPKTVVTRPPAALASAARAQGGVLEDSAVAVAAVAADPATESPHTVSLSNSRGSRAEKERRGGSIGARHRQGSPQRPSRVNPPSSSPQRTPPPRTRGALHSPRVLRSPSRGATSAAPSTAAPLTARPSPPPHGSPLSQHGPTSANAESSQSAKEQRRRELYAWNALARRQSEGNAV